MLNRAGIIVSLATCFKFIYRILHNCRIVKVHHTQPNENGRLFPVPNGTVAIGGG